MEPVHVLLVREADMQMSGSGCCGRIEGDARFWTDEGCVFPERRRLMEEMGKIYVELTEHFGDRVRVDVVDPRNLFSYTTLLWRARKKNGRFRAFWANWVKGYNTTAVIVDGEVVASGKVPAPLSVIKAVDRALADRKGRAG